MRIEGRWVNIAVNREQAQDLIRDYGAYAQTFARVQRKQEKLLLEAKERLGGISSRQNGFLDLLRGEFWEGQKPEWGEEVKEALTLVYRVLTYSPLAEKVKAFLAENQERIDRSCYLLKEVGSLSNLLASQGRREEIREAYAYLFGPLKMRCMDLCEEDARLRASFENLSWEEVLRDLQEEKDAYQGFFTSHAPALGEGRMLTEVNALAGEAESLWEEVSRAGEAYEGLLVSLKEELGRVCQGDTRFSQLMRQDLSLAEVVSGWDEEVYDLLALFYRCLQERDCAQECRRLCEGRQRFELAKLSLEQMNPLDWFFEEEKERAYGREALFYVREELCPQMRELLSRLSALADSGQEVDRGMVKSHFLTHSAEYRGFYEENRAFFGELSNLPELEILYKDARELSQALEGAGEGAQDALSEVLSVFTEGADAFSAFMREEVLEGVPGEKPEEMERLAEELYRWQKVREREEEGRTIGFSPEVFAEEDRILQLNPVAWFFLSAQEKYHVNTLVQRVRTCSEKALRFLEAGGQQEALSLSPEELWEEVFPEGKIYDSFLREHREQIGELPFQEGKDILRRLDLVTSNLDFLSRERREREEQVRILLSRRGPKLRLSVSGKTPENTELLRAVYDDLQVRNREAEEEEPALEKLEDLAAELGRLPDVYEWLSLPREKKRVFSEAFRRAEEFLAGCGAFEGEDYSIPPRGRFTGEEVWEDFASNPGEYYFVIESLCPGLLETGGSFLPEELEREVDEEEILSEGLLVTLRGYQEWGVKYILHQKKVLLGDERGLGKTAEALAAMVSLSNQGATHFLVVCPAGGMMNWKKEVERGSKLRSFLVHGSKRQKEQAEWERRGGVAITSYEGVNQFLLYSRAHIDLLTADEALAVKNKRSGKAMQLMRMTREAERLLFMEGTALENRPEELITLVSYVRPDLCEGLKEKASRQGEEAFWGALAPVYYRRKKEDVLLELPELIRKDEWCTMNAREAAAYREALLSGKAMEARRVSWNTESLNDCGKAARLRSLAEEAKEDGRKVIVFSCFPDTLKRAQDALGRHCFGPVTQSLSREKREEALAAFAQGPAGSVLLCETRLEGAGPDLQAGTSAVFCEPQLSPSEEEQAVAWAFRRNPVRGVLVYRLLCAGSVDERIVQRLEEARDTDEEALGRLIGEEVQRLPGRGRSGRAFSEGIVSESLEDPFSAEGEPEGEV